MNIENCIIHLIGFPGVGKLTIAREIAAQSNFRLIDNHTINNPVFSAVRTDGKTKLPDEIWDKTDQIRQIVLDTIKEIAPAEFNYVFTNVALNEDEDDRSEFAKVAALAADRGGHYVPVHLHCDPEENKKRIDSEERNKAWKTTDPNVVDKYSSNFTLLETGSPNQFAIDVTNLDPKETAALILDNVKDLLFKPHLKREPSA